MKAKRKETVWRETHRQAVGVQATAKRPAFWLVYRVTEVRKVGGRTEYRERIAYGPSLDAYAKPDLALFTLMATVASGIDTLSRYCEALDDERKRAKKGKRRGRS